MVATGPQLYPGASTGHWYEGTYHSDRMEVNTIVLHTTEGYTLPQYGGGSSAPNFTAVPDMVNKKLVWYQHFRVDSSSRALRNLPGGVETNTLNVCQVELVGTCDPRTHTKWPSTNHIFWPQAPEWALKDLAEFLAWMYINHNVPLSGPEEWLPYPQSYGGSSTRMTSSEWNSFKGICGHSHVPEQDHGDPGNLDFKTLISMVNDLVSPTKPIEDTPKPTPDVSYYAYPGASFFKHGKKSPVITAMHRRLIEEGCNEYKTSTHTNEWGLGDVASYRAWQRKLGYSGMDADGIPGPTSWKALKVPKKK